MRKPSAKIATTEEQKKPGILLHHKKTDQVHLSLGVRAFNMFDQRKYALQLMSVMLGGNMSSRLFISVRERNGLGYYVHTNYESSTDTGFLVTQAGIKSDALEKAIELILHEYKDLRDNKITEKELQKAKDYIRGATSLSLDATDAQASFYATQEVMGEEVMTPEQKLTLIEKVTVDDIQKIAQEIFVNEKLNLAVIGPFQESEKTKLEKILIL